MKRVATLFVCLVFLGSLSFSQNPPAPAGPDSSVGQKSEPSGMGMHHMHDMSKMHDQMMKDMQADSDNMRANLQKLKDQIGKVSDRATRDQLQLNIEMWQSLIDHMDKHMTEMKNMMGAHEGPKHEHEHPPAAPKQ